jgi:hypothetical protein
MYSWRFRFKNYQDIKEQKEGIPRNQRLLGYVRLFTENVSQSTPVYAQIRGCLSVLAISDTLVPQNTTKTAILVATTNKK